MSFAMYLAELREILSREVDGKSWLALCEHLGKMEALGLDEGERENAISYVSGHVGKWEASLRKPLYRWWKEKEDGGNPREWGVVGNEGMWLWDEGKDKRVWRVSSR